MTTSWRWWINPGPKDNTSAKVANGRRQLNGITPIKNEAMFDEALEADLAVLFKHSPS